jgi:hypothetical protein
MTAQKKLKARIRDRMTRTGERYAAARAALLGELHRTRPPRAHHDQTFALRRVLEERGYALPTSGTAPGASWLLGLGGGIGVQVFTFQYKGVPPIFYVGTRCAHQYAYDAAFMERALQGMGLTAAVDETGSAKKAEQNLLDRLESGPVVAWVGLEALRGHEAAGGATPWVVVVHDVEDGPEGRVYAIEDADRGSLEVSADHLAAARKALKKGKHRLLIPVGDAPVLEADAIREAVRFCVAELDGDHAVRGHGSSFGLRALERWTEAANNNTKTGWPKVFSPGADQLVGRVQAYGWLERATGGGAFRAMYAEFLSEAGALLGDDRLSTAAAKVAHTSALWSSLAAFLLDDSHPVLQQCRARLTEKPWPAHPAAVGDFAAMAAELPEGFGEDFYEGLAARLTTLLDAERAARDALAEAVA